jgi:hypothetical protein
MDGPIIQSTPDVAMCYYFVVLEERFIVVHL